MCVYLNARSLVNKFDHFESSITAIKPDIVGVTESWTSDKISDSELALSGYDMFCTDRPVDREGGGVSLYVKRELQAFEFVPLTKFIEQIWCQFEEVIRDKFFVGVCYRTPTAKIVLHNCHKA